MRRILSILVLVCLAAAVFAGCSKKSTAPTASGGTAPTGTAPQMVATQPTARATAAIYDGDIWAQFDRPLDGRTVSALTTYLKLDGQRIASDVTYDGITRRVFVKPRSVLALQRTYTVEFSSSIKGLDGTPLPQGVFFQFTTNSLRHIAYDFPDDGGLDGVVATLGWAGTLGAQGNIVYDVYASVDSSEVALRTSPVLQRSVFTRFMTSSAWPAGQRVFWAVTAENLTTHERENGPLHSFQVIDGSVPVDSVVVKPSDHGGANATVRNLQYCNQPTILFGPNGNPAVHWNFGLLPADARIVDVRMRFWLIDANAGAFPTAQPAVWMAQNEWAACAIQAAGPPFAEPSGFLASSFAVDNLEFDLRSDRLAAAMDALSRRRGFVFSTLFRAASNVSVHSPLGDAGKTPVLVIRYQHLPVTGAAR